MSTLSDVLACIDTGDLLGELAKRGLWRPESGGLQLGWQASVGDTLDTIRRVSDWSETQLAREIGVTPTSLHHWRHGRTAPNRRNRAAIGRLLVRFGRATKENAA